MVRSVVVGVTMLLMALIVPARLGKLPEDVPQESYLLIIQDDGQLQNEEIMVTLYTEDGNIFMPIEEYLVGVVLSEMPPSFEMEALKAQAVAARTFSLRQIAAGKHEEFDLCNDSRCCQAWSGKEAVIEKLGNCGEMYWSKAETAVRETKGQAIYYQNQLIDAVYFSCSGGKTEDAVAVWGSDVPYLRSVESPGEENAGPYFCTVEVPVSDFKQRIINIEKDADLSADPAFWFGEIEKTNAGSVQKIMIGGVAFTGQELRDLFHLRSTCFSVSVTKNVIKFDVLGYGHRVGMSQYGANVMAQEGKDYTEIICHYYSDVEIKKHP